MRGEAPQISSYHISVAATLNRRGMQGWQSYKIPPTCTKIPQTFTHKSCMLAQVTTNLCTGLRPLHGCGERGPAEGAKAAAKSLHGRPSWPGGVNPSEAVEKNSLLQAGPQVVKSSPTALLYHRRLCCCLPAVQRDPRLPGAIVVWETCLCGLLISPRSHSTVVCMPLLRGRCTLLDRCSQPGASRACAERTGLFVGTLP